MTGHPLQLWGGVECTVNRVGDNYIDQIELSGHAGRLRADLECFASLGFKALRFPVLWERTAPIDLTTADWRWANKGLEALEACGVAPIVGLLHHGSGPRFTHLLDPNFATQLASFAMAVAHRYPHVETFIPVNEPLTTARFSALYGHWFPHVRSPFLFLRALLNQCRAVVLAMQAIRTVRSDAKLLQTEDLGLISSTPTLAYQACHENERRWLTWDLLSGRLTVDHPLFDYLRWVGLKRCELAWFCDNPCPPDTIGVNYYITSDRFLDERQDYYPSRTHGGNERHRYADVEAVRVCDGPPVGIGDRLLEAWDRYRIPLAITEVHLAGAPGEQRCWLNEIWIAACKARESGVQIRAVTVWALLGAYDWDLLVTQRRGRYEPGAYDVRYDPPQPTELATMVAVLARKRCYDEDVLTDKGWWRRPSRIEFRPQSQPVIPDL